MYGLIQGEANSKSSREIKPPRDERVIDHNVKETELESILHQPPMQLVK